MIDKTPNITEPNASVSGFVDKISTITEETGGEEYVKVSGEQISENLKNINECLKLLLKRVKDVEAYVSELPTPDKTYYKPKGYEDYKNLAENFTEIYTRLDKIENGMQD